MKFFKQMLSEESGTSSKRVNGTIYGLGVVIIVLLSIIQEWTIAQPQENLLQTIFMGSLILFGITGAEKLFKKKDNESVS